MNLQSFEVRHSKNNGQVRASGKAESFRAFAEARARNGDPLSSAQLVGVDLAGAYLPCLSMSNSIVTRASLRGAYLACACFEQADLSGTDLSGAYLSGANFKGANLRGAKLSYACVAAAEFEGADLTGAELTGVDLSRALNVPVLGDVGTAGPKRAAAGR